MRTSGDIFHDWTCLKGLFNENLKRYYFNNIWFCNDPDCLLVRTSKNEEEDCIRPCDRTDAENRTFATVVMATGGCAGKQFGTDGSSYSLAQKFGHRLTPLFPSLVQLKTETDFLKGLKGIKERVKITAYDNDKPIKTIEGDLLFTDYGVSGDAVFKISSYVSGVKNASISIEFLPNLSKAEIVNLIESKRKLTYIAENEILNGLVNKRTGYNLIRYAKDNSANSLANVLKDFRLKVIGTAGFDMSQVTKGGIDTDSINPFTFRSKLQKNLYLIGELLNVDGDCGGYNLTFAFISGIYSANDIIEKY
jgi:predicted Rossmann fold flavoprotein